MKKSQKVTGSKKSGKKGSHKPKLEMTDDMRRKLEERYREIMDSHEMAAKLKACENRLTGDDFRTKVGGGCDC
ncbi:MAG TPA: hypothetical protein VEA59_06230 [Patescibacteria group bacterium]|nr:hypothetical protein [Patescibacteria group bacterium]